MRTIKLSDKQIALLIAALKIAEDKFSELHSNACKLASKMPEPGKERERNKRLWEVSCCFDDLKNEIETGALDV